MVKTLRTSSSGVVLYQGREAKNHTLCSNLVPFLAPPSADTFIRYSHVHCHSLHVGVLADSESEDESSEDEKRRKKEKKSSKKKKRKSHHKKKR